MHTIELTHGRHHETVSQRHQSDAHSLPELQVDAIDLLLKEKRRRQDGLPDGYRIVDEQGRVVRTEWLGLRHA